MYIVLFTVYNVQCTMYYVQCTMYYVQCTVYNVQCTMYCVLCTTNNLQLSIYNVNCTMYTVHCTMYTVYIVKQMYFVYKYKHQYKGEVMIVVTAQIYDVYHTSCVGGLYSTFIVRRTMYNVRRTYYIGASVNDVYITCMYMYTIYSYLELLSLNVIVIIRQTVGYSMQSDHCTVYSVHCTSNNIQYTLFTIYYVNGTMTLYLIQCIVYNEYSIY